MLRRGPSDPVFETVRVENGRIRLWDRHLLRARRSGATGRQITTMRRLAEVYAGLGPTVVRIDVARGQVGACARSPGPTQPVRLATVPGYDPDDAGREHQRADRAWAEAAERSADAVGADEALVVATGARVEAGPEDPVGETTRANLFVIDAVGRVATPPIRGILPGITRGWALEAAGAHEASLRVGDLAGARAAFLTTAERGIMPVAAIDGRPLAQHPVTGDLADAWLRLD